MAARAKKAKSQSRRSRNGEVRSDSGEPRFPYTTKPGSLRRLLKDIPSKPRPPKFDKSLLKSWGFTDTNDLTMLRVLKAVNLLNDRNEPSDTYAAFMNLGEGGRALGPEIQRVYAPFFQVSHTPFNESNEKLKNLFNIHSGGGGKTIDFQIQTFKALCENAIFSGQLTSSAGASLPNGTESAPLAAGGATSIGPGQGAAIHINLHIHLPENKTRRDYEDIIEDIGRYIFGRPLGGTSE